MDQDCESWQDVEHQERQNILPSFEVRGRVHSPTRLRAIRAVAIGGLIGLSFVALLLGNWWAAGMLLMLMLFL